jgi:hypothetical protein
METVREFDLLFPSKVRLKWLWYAVVAIAPTETEEHRNARRSVFNGRSNHIRIIFILYIISYLSIINSKAAEERIRD